jgi:hypothetical protein
MRDMPKAAYRASSSSKSQLTVNRNKGDVTSYHVGRARLQGDTTIKGKWARYLLMNQYLQNLPVAGPTLTPSEAQYWAEKMKRALKR